jgi:serine/threonine-protein kinase HipA
MGIYVTHEMDGRLRIAKFPQKADRMNTVLWEAVALRLAAEAGIQVPIWSLHSVRKKAVLLLDRFDRSVGMRIPFLSAMSMLTANDNEAHSYMEIADTLRRHGAAPAEDLPQLWRRIVFNVLITNTDDHLRNHGFLYAGSEGWRLSPAYDLNPVVGPRVLSLAVDADDRTASLESALSVAEYFELTARNARKVAAEIGRAAAKWRKEAKRVAIGKGELEEMAPAFEHRESRQVLALT